MAIRVYPKWENPTSKQAIKTQKWQLAYFVEANDADRFPAQDLLKLYSNFAIFPFAAAVLRIFCFTRTSFGKTNCPK